MGKTRLTKALKIQFANEFIKSENGFKALENIGLEKDLELLQKLLSDDFVNNYIDKYEDLIEIAEGQTKNAHVKKLQELFKIAAGEQPYTSTKEIDGEKIAVKTRNIDNLGVVRLSNQIASLVGWDEQQAHEIDIDLQLGITQEDTPKEEEREKQVEDHFKKAGLL